MNILDHKNVEIKCPECELYNQVSFKQIRLEESIICGGCKINIVLKDNEGSVKKANKEIQESFNDLEKTIKKFGNIKIKF